MGMDGELLGKEDLVTESGACREKRRPPFLAAFFENRETWGD
jgi:hypothetical protein